MHKYYYGTEKNEYINIFKEEFLKSYQSSGGNVKQEE